MTDDRSTERCGCCDGTESRTPLPTANRPGLDSLRVRVGTHATFFETLTAALSRHELDDGTRPLQALTTREQSDPSLALLDAWATVADVLTFYQERIANEGFLRTATERRSVLELARLVGYRLRPGVAATAYLAFDLEDGTAIDLPEGTKAQSLPGPDEMPQVFETDTELPARSAWNALPARTTLPPLLPPDSSFRNERTLPVEGAVPTIAANDAILLVSDGENAPTPQPYLVQSVQADVDADRSIVAYRSLRPPAESAHHRRLEEDRTRMNPLSPTALSKPTDGGDGERPPALARLGDIVSSLEKPPSLPPASKFQLERPPRATLNAASDLGPQLLTRFVPRLKTTLYTAYANAPVVGDEPGLADRVDVLRVKAAPFGHNAPQELLYNDDNVVIGRREWDLAEHRASFGVELVSEGLPEAVDDAFMENMEPSDSPLALHLSATDGTGSRQSATVRVNALAQDPGGEPGTFTGTADLGRFTAAITARYEEGVFLDELAVQFLGGPEPRAVSIQQRGVINGGSSVLAVQVTGSDRTDVVRGDDETLILAGGTRTARIALDDTAAALRVALDERQFVTDLSRRTLSLDATYDGISPGSTVVIDHADVEGEPLVATVEAVQTVSRADYGIAAKGTQLVLDEPWLTGNERTLSALRSTTVYAQNETVPLDKEIIRSDVGGSEIELDGVYDGLEAGRWIVVTGERTDVGVEIGKIDPDAEGVAGIEASELVMLAGVEHKPHTTVDAFGTERERAGDTLHTHLTLSEPLAYTYKRDTVQINANVVKASHGETREEVLGSGDGATSFQTFPLRQTPPLTYRSAPTVSGVENTLDVRVGDVRWPERETLLDLDGGERGYVTSTDDDGKVTVRFGDGTHGARLPTGVENVSAVYRTGIGRSGNVEAGAISTLASRPLGVKSVVNPEPATGGADPEGRDQARQNAPLAVLALDRLVSVEDYASFARTYAGIGKAHADQMTDGRRSVVHLTIAGADDAPIDVRSDLHRNLQRSLRRYGDPSLPLQVEVREAVFLVVVAKVTIHETYLWDTVAPKIQAALLDVFSFERRDLGQDVRYSEVVAAMQAVDGVDLVDVDLLDGIAETDASDPRVLAERLDALAAAATEAAPPPERVRAETTRLVSVPGSSEKTIRPAQIAYLNPELPDTLILTEGTQ